MHKQNIRVHPEACVECLSCQLICSLTYQDRFVPEEAYIQIDPRIDTHDMVKIRFTEDCVKECSLCVRYCVFEALAKV